VRIEGFCIDVAKRYLVAKDIKRKIDKIGGVFELSLVREVARYLEGKYQPKFQRHSPLQQKRSKAFMFYGLGAYIPYVNHWKVSCLVVAFVPSWPFQRVFF
jgi:hypothetical protein